jgi:hypothetical protein
METKGNVFFYFLCNEISNYAEMKKRACIVIVFLVFGASTSFMYAQQESKPAYDYGVSLDIQTRYVWRGSLCGGSSPSMQPAMNFSWKGLEIGAWGAFSLARIPTQELDLYLSYTFWKERFTVSVTDYCFPDETSGVFEYFNYHKTNTSHVFEAGLTYNGEEKVPISVGVHCIFYGADAKSANGNNLFSSYAEIAYNPTFKKIGVDFSVFAGFALNGQNYDVVDTTNVGMPIVYHHHGFYNNKGFAYINTGISATKAVKIGEYLTMPLSVALIFNPSDNKAFLTASIGLAL